MRLLAGAGLLLAVAVVFILVAVHHLDAPWLKPRLQRLISGVAGFEADWRSLHVDLGAGIHVDELEVKTPPAFRAQAPDLLRAQAVDIDASVFGGLRAIHITNGHITIVQEAGHRSWEGPITRAAQTKNQDLSQVLAELFSKPPPIPATSLDSGSLTWINVDPGQPLERVRVSGLKLTLQGWAVTLGSAATPARLELRYQRGEAVHTATLDVQASASADRRGLVTSIDADVVRQDWAPELSVGKLLSVRLASKFDTAHRMVDFDLDRAQLLDDTATLKGGATLPDDPAAFPTVRDLDGAVDLERLTSFLAPLKLPVSVDRGALHFHARNTDAIDVDGKANRLVVDAGGATVSLAGASLTATLGLRGPQLLRAKLNGHCTAAAPHEKPWFNEDVQLDVKAENVARDFSRARVRGTVEGRWGQLAVEDEHHAAHEVAHITFRFPNLALLRPLLPKAWPIDWASASATGRIDGQARFGSKRLKIHQTSEIAVQNLIARLPAGPLAVQSVSAKVRSEETDRDHHAELGLRLAGIQWRGSKPWDQTLDATLDIAAANTRLHLKTDGALAPSVSAEVQADFDRTRHELVSQFTANAGHASFLAPFLEHVPGLAKLDLGSLEAAVSGRAHLQGISRFDRRTLGRARGEARLEATVRNARWLGEDQSASIASARFEAAAKGDGQQATLESHLDIQGAKYTRDDDSYSATPISLRVSAALNRRSGEANAHGELEVGPVLQSEGFDYPLEGLKLSFSLERQADGVLFLPSARLENPAAGTMLEVRGGLALQENPAKLSAHGTLTQDLSKVWRNADVFSAHGRAELRFDVESPDSRVFDASSVLTLNGVDFRMPAWGLIAEGVDSEIPLLGTFALKSNGIAAIRKRHINPYSALRFADQYPLFRQQSYLSIRRLVMPQVTLESFAGNLKVDHNLISMDQMEMSVRGGHLAGQCLVDTDPKRLRAKAELRAVGILSSHGEPFDGNAAISISLRDRSVDGRAEILRIGRQHLLDLLDLEDPQHALPAFNRVRQALGLGYPDKMKVTFDRGFANVHITFGGLAKLVKVDDLRGIPMEPLLDKYLTEATKEEL